MISLFISRMESILPDFIDYCIDIFNYFLENPLIGLPMAVMLVMLITGLFRRIINIFKEGGSIRS